MQKDLFGASTVSTLANPYEQKSDFLQRFRIQLKLDQTIIGVLLLLVAYVLIFSFGVESGKRYAMAEIKAERAMRERMARELGEKIFANSHPKDMTAPGHFGAAAAVTVTATVPAAQTTDAVAAPIAPKSETLSAITTSSKGKFWIQTVTYTSKAAAEEELKRIAKKGFAGKIIPRGKFQQVCVGGFETRVQATEALVQLKAQKLAPQDAYIRNFA